MFNPRFLGVVLATTDRGLSRLAVNAACDIRDAFREAHRDARVHAKASRSPVTIVQIFRVVPDADAGGGGVIGGYAVRYVSAYLVRGA